jgi:hypothetical protein
MINCAHPTHFADVMAAGASWVGRIRGVRANASTHSHAELDAATTLDAGDPLDLGQRYRALRLQFPRINVSAAAAAPTIGTSNESATRVSSRKWSVPDDSAAGTDGHPRVNLSNGAPPVMKLTDAFSVPSACFQAG